MPKRKRSRKVVVKRSRPSVQEDEGKADVEMPQDSTSCSSIEVEEVQSSVVNSTIIIPVLKIEEADSSSEVISVGSSSPIIQKTFSDGTASKEECPVGTTMYAEITTSPDISSNESIDYGMEVLVSNCKAEPVLRECLSNNAEESCSTNDAFICKEDSKNTTRAEDLQSNVSSLTRIEPTLELPDIVATAFAQVFDHSPLLLPRTSSMVPIETVKGIVRGTGRQNFTAEASAHIAMDATFITKLLLQEANKFREAGHRSSLVCSDIDSALNLLAAKQPVFGLGLPVQMKSSLSERISSNLVYERNQFVTPEILAADLQNLSVPRGPSVLSHWLITADSLDVLYWPEKPDIDVEQICRNYDSGEDENSEEGMADISENNFAGGHSPKHVENRNPSQLVEFLMKRRSSFSQSELIHLRSVSCGLLSKELECYFQSLCGACIGYSEDKRNIAFASLEHDPNMIPLASFIVSFIKDQTEHYVKYPDMKKLQILMTMAKQLMLNEYIATSIKQYLHMIVPAVMTCIVCSTICANPEYEHHWQLRNYAADLLKFICDKYSNEVNTIRERAIKELKKALKGSSNKSSGTVYGILYALKAFGADVVKSELEYIDMVVKKQAEFVLSSPITVDSTDRTNSVRIKDLITQIVQLVENTGTPNVPKIKTRIVSKDHETRFDNAKNNSNSRPQPLVTRKPPPPRKVVPVPSKPAPIIPAGPRPMPIPRFPSLGPSLKSVEVVTPDPITQTQNLTSVSSPIQNKPDSIASISTNIDSSPPPVLVHPSKIFHTYTLKSLPIPRSVPKSSRPRLRSSNKPVNRRLPATVSPSFPFPRTPMAFPGAVQIMSPRISSPKPPSPGETARKYVLVPLQKDSRVPSLESINSLLKGQLPSNAAIVSPENILPVDVIAIDTVPESAGTLGDTGNTVHNPEPNSGASLIS